MDLKTFFEWLETNRCSVTMINDEDPESGDLVDSYVIENRDMSIYGAGDTPMEAFINTGKIKTINEGNVAYVATDREDDGDDIDSKRDKNNNSCSI